MSAGPWSSKEEQRMDDTIARASDPAGVAGFNMQRPPEVLFPPRFGYGSKDERTPTIASVLDAGRWFADRRVNWTGGEGAFAGTSTPAMSSNPF